MAAVVPAAGCTGTRHLCGNGCAGTRSHGSCACTDDPDGTAAGYNLCFHNRDNNISGSCFRSTGHRVHDRRNPCSDNDRDYCRPGTG